MVKSMEAKRRELGGISNGQVCGSCATLSEPLFAAL
jgi:hypothetical protein